MDRMKITNRWLILAIVIVATTIGMMSFAAPFALIPIWTRELGLTKAEAGLLSGFWYLPGIAISLPAGWAFDRYAGRRVMLACWGCILLGAALSSFATSFVLLCAGRLIFSTGMNAHMVGAPKILGGWFAGRRDLGWIMGLYTLSFTAGVYLALNLLGRIGEASGSAAALRVVAWLSVVGLLLIVVVPRAPNDAAPTLARDARPSFRPWQLGAGAWVLAIGYFGYSIGTEAYLTFAPDYLTGTGMAVGAASAAIGTYGLFSFGLKPVLASFLTRERAGTFIALAIVAALASSWLLFTDMSPRVSAAAMGVSLAFGMPAWMAFPTFLYGGNRSGQVYGLYQLLYSLGFFAQPLVGAVADRASYASAFGVVAVYTVLGLGALLPIIRRGGDVRAPTP